MKVMYPGSFDPITTGHLDLIERCSRMFDEVIVAIMVNESKSGTFSREERLEIANECVAHLDNVTVEIGNGLTADFAVKRNCNVLVRGIRAVMDYEYELQQATANRVLIKDLETLFLVADPKYSHISSSVAREVARYGGNLEGFVPANVATRLYKYYKE
ncbi:pantetheine-phosphate adenylyltransferase [Erysipelothrix sp. HDW6C]|uniref:pantetheine-phosphate adenylyltransferase n=1 Tax=Erysipelothrix sp. HDW6C TaxID=2714930 RepID=UPI001409FC5D|nr:pantetheine-phosphate adenylyltransferase [Erysipelothrix sp. HDW6C]QIK69865.1 pantetheine-phosphate adenylyltransferase [Erysipelothrix sp. HDW6C]